MAVFTAAEALKMAMEIEQNGEVFYNEAAGNTGDAEVKALFEDLAVQERGHFKTFQRMLEGTRPAPELPAGEFEDYQMYVHSVLENALFAGKEKALALAAKAQDRETALRAAMGFEKDTMLFFYDLREMVGDADREMISGVIREEKMHLRRLAKML